MVSGKLDAECRIRRVSDGQVIYVSAVGQVRHDGDGQPVGLVGICVNITARKQLEMELMRSQKMEAIGRLAGGVAHDFNNMLGIILGHAELLLEIFPEGHAAAVHVDEIKKSTEKAASLTRQLLAFSRKQLLQSKVVDLNELIAGMASMLTRLIGEHLEFIFEPGADLNKVKVDPVQIDQVLMNLVINARDAMPEGGKLKIKTTNIEVDDALVRENSFLEKGPHVLVQISDTGSGMDKETRARIFEPFFTTKSMGKGTGLGLSIVYGIVKQSHGFIVVDSEIGKGTVFSLYFPRVQDEQRTAAFLPSKQVPLAEGKHTILVVEDEAPLANMIRKGLEGRGYTILQASRAEEALHLSGQYPNKIHLLLTDVVLKGGVDGTVLAKRLKEQRPELKVIYMSGYSEVLVRDTERTGSEAPMVAKPFTITALQKTIAEVLQPSRPDVGRENVKPFTLQH